MKLKKWKVRHHTVGREFCMPTIWVCINTGKVGYSNFSSKHAGKPQLRETVPKNVSLGFKWLTRDSANSPTTVMRRCAIIDRKGNSSIVAIGGLLQAGRDCYGRHGLNFAVALTDFQLNEIENVFLAIERWELGFSFSLSQILTEIAGNKEDIEWYSSKLNALFFVPLQRAFNNVKSQAVSSVFFSPRHELQKAVECRDAAESTLVFGLYVSACVAQAHVHNVTLDFHCSSGEDIGTVRVNGRQQNELQQSVTNSEAIFQLIDNSRKSSFLRATPTTFVSNSVKLHTAQSMADCDYRVPNTSPPAHDTSQSDHDTSQSDHDTSQSDHDTSQSDHDTSPSAHDTSPPVHDSSQPVNDSSPPVNDSSAPVHDSLRTELDDFRPPMVNNTGQSMLHSDRNSRRQNFDLGASVPLDDGLSHTTKGWFQSPFVCQLVQWLTPVHGSLRLGRPSPRLFLILVLFAWLIAVLCTRIWFARPAANVASPQAGLPVSNQNQNFHR
jgi:hypothetical protein